MANKDNDAELNAQIFTDMTIAFKNQLDTIDDYMIKNTGKTIRPAILQMQKNKPREALEILEKIWRAIDRGALVYIPGLSTRDETPSVPVIGENEDKMKFRERMYRYKIEMERLGKEYPHKKMREDLAKNGIELKPQTVRSYYSKYRNRYDLDRIINSVENSKE